MGWFRRLVRSVKRVFHRVVRRVRSTFRRAFTRARSVFSRAKRRISRFVSRVRHTVRKFTHSVRNRVRSFFHRVKSHARTIATRVRNALARGYHGLRSFASRAKKAVGSFISRVKHYAGRAYRKVVSWVRKAKKVVKGVVSKVIETVRRGIGRVWDGLKNGVNTVVKAAKTVGNSIPSFVRNNPWVVPAVTVPLLVGGTLLIGNVITHTPTQPTPALPSAPSSGASASANPMQWFVPGRDVFNPSAGGASSNWLPLLAGGLIAAAGAGLVWRKATQPSNNPIISKINAQMIAIRGTRNLATAKANAEKLKELIEKAKQSDDWERYKDLISEAERIIKGVEKAYHDLRLNTERENIREIIRSPSPFDDIALYTSTGMLDWKDPFNIVSYAHGIAGYVGLESREQAYENIVRIKAEQMLEMEDNMGTAEHPKPLGIFAQAVSSPFVAAAGALVAGELGLGARIESFLSKHRLLSTGLKAGDYAFNAIYVGSVVDDVRKGNWEGVIRDIGFIGLIGGIRKISEAGGGFKSIDLKRTIFSNHAVKRIAERKFTTAEINNILLTGELYYDTKTHRFVRFDANLKAAVVYEIDENKNIIIKTVLGKGWEKLDKRIKLGRWVRI